MYSDGCTAEKKSFRFYSFYCLCSLRTIDWQTSQNKNDKFLQGYPITNIFRSLELQLTQLYSFPK